jgi:hypothetical protein
MSNFQNNGATDAQMNSVLRSKATKQVFAELMISQLSSVIYDIAKPIINLAGTGSNTISFVNGGNGASPKSQRVGLTFNTFAL